MAACVNRFSHVPKNTSEIKHEECTPQVVLAVHVMIDVIKTINTLYAKHRTYNLSRSLNYWSYLFRKLPGCFETLI